MKTDLFQSFGHCWVFQICWHIECSTCTASSFRVWNSSTGIPSPPLALFIVMFPKAHLTSHSRMSGCMWVITPSWLSGLWRSFLYRSVYSCRILISCASIRSVFPGDPGSFLSFIEVHLCMKCSLGISNFLEEISSLSHSIFSLHFFALITEESFLISPCYSLELYIQMGISFLSSFAFCFPFFTVICKNSGSHFAFLHFFFYESMNVGNLTSSSSVWCVSVSQSCPTLWDPKYCSLPGSSVHGFHQAIILEWVAIPFLRYLPDLGIEPGSPGLHADSLPL